MSHKNATDFIRALEAWIRQQDNFTEGFDPEANELNLPDTLAAKFPCICVQWVNLGNAGCGPNVIEGWTGEFMIKRDNDVWMHAACGTRCELPREEQPSPTPTPRPKIDRRKSKYDYPLQYGCMGHTKK